MYSATSSLVRFEHKNISIYYEKRFSLLPTNPGFACTYLVVNSEVVGLATDKKLKKARKFIHVILLKQYWVQCYDFVNFLPNKKLVKIWAFLLKVLFCTVEFTPLVFAKNRSKHCFLRKSTIFPTKIEKK
jgi:hypothetical protein